MIKKIILPLLFCSTISFGAPVLPPNGGSGIANCSTCTTTILAPVSLSSSASSELDITSSTRGSHPFPGLTTSQVNGISSPEIGLHAYDTVQGVDKYWDGLQYQTIATLDKILAGANVAVTQNGDGTLTISASGGSISGASAYSNFSFSNNGFATTFPLSNTYYPVAVNSTTFNDLSSSDFVNEVSTISLVPTPVMRYTGAATQQFQSDFNIYLRGSAPSQQTYILQEFIEKADTSIVFTNCYATAVVQNLIFPVATPISCIVELSTGDRVGIAAENVGNTVGFVSTYGNASIQNINTPTASSSTWIPTLTAVSGISGTPTLYGALYTKVGSIITFTVDVSAVSTTASMTLGISPPVAAGFTANNQAFLAGQSFSDESSPTVADGKVISLKSNVSPQRIDANILSAIGSGSKEIIVSGMYEVQP